MKIIPNYKTNTSSVKSSSSRSSKKSAPMSATSFSKMVEDTPDEPILESIFSEPDHVLSNISVLADELDKIGQELAEKPLPEVFNRYKKHIRLLLKGASRNMEIRETTARSGLTRTKLFRTAQAIDEALAELAKRILNDEKNRMDILKITNQLQGLILDIIT